MKLVCRCCGLAPWEHHDFEPQMPDGCVCNPGEWGDEVCEPCAEYVGDGHCYCEQCEHDQACHKPPNVADKRHGTYP